MKKLLGISLLLVLMIALAACSSTEDVSTGSDSESAESSEKSNETDDNAKKVDASDQSVTAANLKVGLGDVKVLEDKIQVGINVENTASDAVSFYPDQGSAVIGDMQLDANMFLTDGSVSGDIQASVKKEGVLEFLAPEGKKIDPATVKEIKLVLGDATSADFMTTEPVEFTVTVE
ncbi:hypothetical protein SAMN05421503_2093 [Terribacillus aidingensis]|uniref:DUF4352 domain-containing protein n=1 Tax=Terribacillus aidingensis TaxID=586416 RepID=A0A285NPZ3_9BACI|nr:hypothetical protein [Terribacillus aidingensis]SNZ11594.1 hypothetical protein SAMN05421503_2093 [Terribacillus aidingensis]